MLLVDNLNDIYLNALLWITILAKHNRSLHNQCLAIYTNFYCPSHALLVNHSHGRGKQKQREVLTGLLYLVKHCKHTTIDMKKYVVPSRYFTN
jgi:hypothetical protein